MFFEFPFEIPYLLTLLLVVPLIGAVATLAMGGERQKYAKYVAGTFSGIAMVLSLVLLFTPDLSVYNESYTWIETAGVRMSYILTVDGLSILMVFLTGVLVFLSTVFSAREHDRPHYFFALLLAMEVGLMGVYMAGDYFLFYILWEVTLIPMYFLIAWFGGPRRHYAAIKFFIYTHVASLVMLIGIFAIVFGAAGGGTVDFSFAAVLAGSAAFSTTFQTLVFGLLFFGFAVKMPIVPFHTWLPDAHTEAPTAGSVLLAGVMLKMGSYGIIRVCLELLPDGAQAWQMTMVFIGILAMVYGAYACIAQKDLKKMVAFSSISHMGMVMIAMACLSDIGIQFAVFQMFAHGLISAVLFMVAGAAGHNIGTREIPLLGGLAGKLPVFAAFMMFGFLASLGLPGLVGFWAEFGIIFSFYEYTVSIDMIWLIAFCLITLLLTAGYYLWAAQRTLFGRLTTKIDLTHIHDLSRPEVVALGATCALIALFGLWPDLALGFIKDYASSLALTLGAV
ncbi:MAG: NADH-quinone oxidoreductase subunit M [Candidatus Methanoplasma sp.]|jgi:NADH-quinone oxidoreductase subunit M|nr:NADH-quinone oxidoreductase subunit M [Candidatus Methanoplasma sp.]